MTDKIRIIKVHNEDGTLKTYHFELRGIRFTHLANVHAARRGTLGEYPVRFVERPEIVDNPVARNFLGFRR